MSNWSRDLLGVDTLSEVSGSATISTNTLTLNLSTATTFYISLNDNITSFVITNVRTGVSSFTLIFTADGTARSITWPGSFLWPGGTPPTLTSTNGKEDVFSFVSLDGGTSWLSFNAGQNL